MKKESVVGLGMVIMFIGFSMLDSEGGGYVAAIITSLIGAGICVISGWFYRW